MKNQLTNMLTRKVTATVIATIITSIWLAFWGTKDSTSEIIYNLDDDFVGGLITYVMYIGVIIFTYGNLVSIGIEYLQRKWFQKHHWLSIFLHGIGGAAPGLFIPEFLALFFLLYGTLAALLYACVDRWLYISVSKKKGVLLFFLFSLMACMLCWGYFYFTSPPLPPFTKEDAVDFTTRDNGTVTDVFPNKIGKWQGTVDGYEVQRETSVKELKEEIYIVTFKENWSKGNEKGSSLLSYKVDRGSSSAYDEKGEMPPY